MNMNGSAENGVDNLKSQISDFKEDGTGAPNAVTVGDAAVTVVGEELGAAGAAKGFGARTRRIGVRRARVLNSRKRWGKIARMPLEVREWLNEQMRDGVRYAEISAALTVKGFAGVTKFDLSDWRRGGHQEWLLEQERIAALRNDVERVVKAAESLSEKDEDGVERLNEMLIGMQIVHALQDLHRGTLKSLVEKKPELLFRVAKVASDQARDRARRKRVSLLVRKYEDRVAKEKVDVADREPGLSEETLVEIEKALAKML